MTKLSIVIVNYNAGIHLSECLASIKMVESEADIFTYVIDNASVDGSIFEAKKNYPWAQYILNKSNLGFGKANNIVLRQIKTEYVLLLNPDTTLEKGVITGLLKYMGENPQVGGLTCEIVLPDGAIDLTAHRGFPTPWASLLYFLGNDSLYHLSKSDMKKPHEVDAISGAFFMTRRSVIEEVNFFDEDYFLYGEDIDLCYKIKKAGYKIMYVPDFKIFHHKGISSGLKKHSQQVTTANIETRKKSLDAFYEAMKIFYRKNYQSKYPFFINWLVYLGINLRWMIAKRKLLV